MKRTVMAVVLLVLAVGGTAMAAGTITGKQVKDGSVTGVDVRDGSVAGVDVAAGTLVAADFGRLPAGPQGERGPRGPQGARGPQGPAGLPGLRYVLDHRSVAPGGESEQWSVTCPDQTRVIAGGVSSDDPGLVTFTQSYPLAERVGWSGHAVNTAPFAVTAYVWAVCGSS